MSIIVKQLILNQLGFTSVIIDMIKEYAFYDVILKTKENKNKIIATINNTYHSPLNYKPINFAPHISDTQYIFWIDEDFDSAQFQNEFCIQCGNYIISYNASKNIICNCPSP